MKSENMLYEIKAFIRPERIDAVVHSLEELGVCQMTLIDVSALGRGADPDSCRFSIEFLEKYSTLVRLELVCPQERVDALLDAITTAGRTGRPGDGYLYMTAVSRLTELSPDVREDLANV